MIKAINTQVKPYITHTELMVNGVKMIPWDPVPFVEGTSVIDAIVECANSTVMTFDAECPGKDPLVFRLIAPWLTIIDADGDDNEDILCDGVVDALKKAAKHAKGNK